MADQIKKKRSPACPEPVSGQRANSKGALGMIVLCGVETERNVDTSCSQKNRSRIESMTNPMLVQYIVGLCCLRRDPDAVDVTVGDLVLDTAARKRRDVDVTVTVKEGDGTVRAFKAYEVKREAKSLDVVAVEQLCAKLNDMPDVTHRAVVSSSGFTEGAIAKAASHNVELYELKVWTEPIKERFKDFPNVGRPDEFLPAVGSNLLCWVNWNINYYIPDAKSPVNFENSAPLFSNKGKKHSAFKSVGDFNWKMLQRSTDILWRIEPAVTLSRIFPLTPQENDKDVSVGPAWPHTHTLQVKENGVFVKINEKIANIDSVTINGSLQWQRRDRIPEFYLLESVPPGRIFAGAAIAEIGNGDGRMFAMIFPESSRELGVHQFQLNEKQRNMIRGLKIRAEGG
jgi:hypothetical protein